MSAKTDQNRVRQVLMNELGLTRESVREEMMRIVSDTIERALNAPDIRDRITTIIEWKVGYALQRYGDTETLKKFVETQTVKEAEAQARELIRERIQVTLALKR